MATLVDVRSPRSVRCWAVYLDTETAQGLSREMLGVYFTVAEAEEAQAMWEAELAAFPTAHLPSSGRGRAVTEAVFALPNVLPMARQPPHTTRSDPRGVGGS